MDFEDTAGSGLQQATGVSPCRNESIVAHGAGDGSVRLSAEHLKKLSQSALTTEHAASLLGVGWHTDHTGSLVIPYRQPDGAPETCRDGKQFARRRLTDEQRAERIRNGEKDAKYLSPADNGCRLYYPALGPGKYERRLQDINIPLRFVEGEIKAECAEVYASSSVNIGQGGVYSWKDSLDDGETSRPLVDFDSLPTRGREVRICFDSDLATNPMVFAALKEQASFLVNSKQACQVLIEQIPCDLDGSKLGIDDLIFKYGPEAFQIISQTARSAGIVEQVEDARSGAKVSKLKWKFSAEPTLSHHKAVMAWAVFKNDYAERPGIGTYQWQGTHWSMIEGGESLKAPLHKWMDYMGWGRRSLSEIKSILDELKTRLRRSGWESPKLMAFANGTLDTSTGIFTKGHRREDLLTFAFPFDFDVLAGCPRWNQFLDEVIGDSEMIQLLRAAIRWTLMPKNPEMPYRHELAFDAHGPRGRGKGTLSEVIQILCGGSRGVGQIKSESFSNPNTLFSLLGKKAAIDPDASGRVSDPGVFNNIASNEPVHVKKLYSNVSAARLGVVMWRFYNDQPGASGGGLEGMGRRIVTFRFDRPVQRPDRELKEKLIAEAPGIFQWVWSMSEGSMHAVLSDVGSIKAVREAAKEAAIERHPLLRFLLELYPDGVSDIEARELYRQWCNWCEREGHKETSSTTFGKDVKKIEAVSHRLTKRGTRYQIAPMSKFDIASSLGLAVASPGAQPGGELGGELVVSWPKNPPPTLNPPPISGPASGSEPVETRQAAPNPPPFGPTHHLPTTLPTTPKSQSGTGLLEGGGEYGGFGAKVSQAKRVDRKKLLESFSPPTHHTHHPSGFPQLPSNLRIEPTDTRAWVGLARDTLGDAGLEMDPRACWELLARWHAECPGKAPAGISQAQAERAHGCLPAYQPIGQQQQSLEVG